MDGLLPLFPLVVLFMQIQETGIEAGRTMRGERGILLRSINCSFTSVLPDGASDELFALFVVKRGVAPDPESVVFLRENLRNVIFGYELSL